MICQLIGVIQMLSFQDCIAAFNLMAEQPFGLHEILRFGRGSDIDVRIDGDPLSWEVGTHSKNPIFSNVRG